MTELGLVETSIGPLLGWAANVLSRALDATGERPEPVGGLESLRGLLLSREAVLVGLSASRTTLASAADAPPLPFALHDALTRAGADEFDAAAIGLAIAVELDPSLARTVAYLHDDARRRRFSVDLLAAICSPLADGWANGMSRLTGDGPLTSRGLLEISGLGGAAELTPTTTVIRYATGLFAPAPQLAPVISPMAAVAVSAHEITAARWAFDPYAHVLHVHGAPADVLSARVAAALIGIGRSAVRVDLGNLEERHIGPLAAHCLLHELAAVLILPPAGHPLLERALGTLDAVCIVDCQLALWQARPSGLPRAVASVELAQLDTAERAAATVDGLLEHDVVLADAAAAVPFARRYRLGPDGISRTVAATAARLRGSGRRIAESADLLDTAATLAGVPLRDLATRVERSAGWADLAVPEPIAVQLRELCDRVDARDAVLDDRGYAQTLGATRGVSALFAGPSGAGKTLAASVIAGELGLALYRVDLARVVSKYIGETERNLEAVFAAAESTDVVLLFDEADALFGRRSEVSDAHDRYANLEVAYLLQRIETYDGVAILSTNLMRNLDEAFTRRLDFRVIFPFPAEPERCRIWRLMWPAGEQLAADIDFDAMAAEHELSGGMIRNAVLAAAHLAAAEGAPVSRAHLDHAIRREYDKLGRLPRLLTSTDQ